MGSIAESMSRMGGGGKHGGGIAGAMDRREHEREPEHEGVHEHLKALHAEMGGKHMHVHEHEGGYTTHHVKEDGKVEGPHEHQDREDLKEHMDKVFGDEEEQEPHKEEHDGLM